MQYDDIIGVDAQPHLLVQQAIGFLFGEGELLGTYLVHLSPCEPPPQWQRRVGARGDDEGDVLREVVFKKSDEPLPRGTHSHENVGSKVLFFRHDLTQRLYYVSPQPNRIVILLVEGDPAKGHLGFFYLTPVGKQRRLSVAGRGA